MSTEHDLLKAVIVEREKVARQRNAIQDAQNTLSYRIKCQHASETAYVNAFPNGTEFCGLIIQPPPMLAISFKTDDGWKDGYNSGPSGIVETRKDFPQGAFPGRFTVDVWKVRKRHSWEKW